MTWNAKDAQPPKPQDSVRVPLSLQPDPLLSDDPDAVPMLPTVAALAAWEEEGDLRREEGLARVPLDLERELAAQGLVTNRQWAQWRRRVTRGIPSL